MCTNNRQKSDSYNQRLRTGAKKREKNDRFPDPVEKLGYLSIPILSTTVINRWPYKSYKTIANKVNVCIWIISSVTVSVLLRGIAVLYFSQATLKLRLTARKQPVMLIKIGAHVITCNPGRIWIMRFSNLLPTR